MFETIKKARIHMDREVRWQKRFDRKAPKVGEMAPDFALMDVNGERRVRLLDFRGEKPVGLIFGSFT